MCRLYKTRVLLLTTFCVSMVQFSPVSSVFCSTDGGIRLVGGSTLFKGRIEVCSNGEWGTVCDYLFGSSDASVACRQLGFATTGATYQCCAGYGRGAGRISLAGRRCSGTEMSLFHCPHSGIGSHRCRHSEDVGVSCQELRHTCSELESPTNGSVQVSNTTVGGIALYTCTSGYALNGVSTRVCRDDGSWSGEEPSCRRIPCPKLSPPSNGNLLVNFQIDTGHIVLYTCSTGYTLVGLTTRICLGDDTWSGTEPFCELTSWRCHQGDIQLAGGSSRYEGRLEVCNNNAWGTVCDDYFGSSDARVACRQLGFSDRGAGYSCCASYGRGSGSIVFKSLRCSGSETSLFNCPKLNSYCSHSEDVGLSCQALSVQDASLSCPGLSIPTNGSVSYTSQRVGHIARYNCSTGYILEGSSSRTCLAGGYWSGHQPNCSGQCPPLINPSNGTVVVNSTRVGRVAFYSCSTGYTRIGLSTRVCLTRETWSGVEPECIFTGGPCRQGDIRLARGSRMYEGRLEVCNNNTWGTVCDNYFGSYDARVACRQLGFSDRGAGYRCCASYGRGSGSIVFTNLRCSGSETSLFNCRKSTSYCSHSEDVGLSCNALSVQEATVSCTRLFSPSNGTISLTGLGVGHIARYTCSTGYTLEGSSARTCLAGGYWSGQQSNCWGPCPPLINPFNGTVVVNSTRVGGVAFYSCSTGYTRIGLSTRVCLTRETWSGVEPECISTDGQCRQGDIRLVGGSSRYEGRLEVCNNNAWGTVCDDNFGSSDARVACRQLGFSDRGAGYSCCASYGRGSGSIVFENLRCSGSETSLFNCPKSTSYCSHSEDIGLSCNALTVQEATMSCTRLYFRSNGAVSLTGFGVGHIARYTCSTGYTLEGSSSRTCLAGGYWSGHQPSCTFISAVQSIRLVGGSTRFSGRIEVFSNGQWGTVCDDGFSSVDANVACRQLGFSGSGAIAQCCARFGQGTGRIVLSNLACYGTETSLFQCSHSQPNCGHSEDVGVVCKEISGNHGSSTNIVGVTVGPLLTGTIILIIIIFCGSLVMLKMCRRRTLERRTVQRTEFRRVNIVSHNREMHSNDTQLHSEFELREQPPPSRTFQHTDFRRVNIVSHNRDMHSNDTQLQSESELREQPPPSYQDARHFNTYQPTSDTDSTPTNEPPAYNVNDALPSAVDQLQHIQQL